MVEYAPGYPHNKALLINQKGMTYGCMPQPEGRFKDIIFDENVYLKRLCCIMTSKDQPRNEQTTEEENGLIIAREQGWGWGRMERVRHLSQDVRTGDSVVLTDILGLNIWGGYRNPYV